MFKLPVSTSHPPSSCPSSEPEAVVPALDRCLISAAEDAVSRRTMMMMMITCHTFCICIYTHTYRSTHTGFLRFCSPSVLCLPSFSQSLLRHSLLYTLHTSLPSCYRVLLAQPALILQPFISFQFTGCFCCQFSLHFQSKN